MIARELDPTERELLFRAAILTPWTPSAHDGRSWRFGCGGDTVEVYRDLPEDCGGRWSVVGVGAALFNLRIAAAALARGTTTTLFPDPSRPELLAQVRVWPGPGAEVSLAGLLLHLYRPRPSRCSYADHRIPAAVRLELERAATAEGATLTWPDDRPRDGVGSLGECLHGVLHSALDDGLCAPYDEPWTRVVLTMSDTTADACPHDWLVAGQALQRVLLVAARNGLSGSALGELEELDRFDESVGWPGGAFGTSNLPRAGGPVQVGLRLGWGPAIARTPRRPPADFVADDLCS